MPCVLQQPAEPVTHATLIHVPKADSSRSLSPQVMETAAHHLPATPQGCLQRLSPVCRLHPVQHPCILRGSLSWPVTAAT